jgi:hypothetical protein
MGSAVVLGTVITLFAGTSTPRLIHFPVCVPISECPEWLVEELRAEQQKRDGNKSSNLSYSTITISIRDHACGKQRFR